MNIQQRAIEQLEQLAAKGPKEVEAIVKAPSEAGYIIGVPAIEGKGSGASLSIRDYDRYSVTLKHLEVYDNSLAVEPGQTRAYLERCAARLNQSITYLEEPLILLELDPVEGIAQLRSETPSVEGPASEPDQAQLFYWEIMLQTMPHPRAKIARYRWQAGQSDRENLIYPATFITLGRLIKDMAESLAGAGQALSE
jgi:hypothetical protein